jgi:hypothetical protein
MPPTRGGVIMDSGADGVSNVVCCARCAAVDRWSYEVDGDGDGIEFLVETGHRRDSTPVTTTVVFAATGV